MPDRFLGVVTSGRDAGGAGCQAKSAKLHTPFPPDPPLRICDLASTELWPTYPPDAALGSRQHALAKIRDRHCASDAASDACGRQLGHPGPCAHIRSLEPPSSGGPPTKLGGSRPVSRLSSFAKTLSRFRGRLPRPLHMPQARLRDNPIVCAAGRQPPRVIPGSRTPNNRHRQSDVITPAGPNTWDEPVRQHQKNRPNTAFGDSERG